MLLLRLGFRPLLYVVKDMKPARVFESIRLSGFPRIWFKLQFSKYTQRLVSVIDYNKFVMIQVLGFVNFTSFFKSLRLRNVWVLAIKILLLEALLETRNYSHLFPALSYFVFQVCFYASSRTECCPNIQIHTFVVEELFYIGEVNLQSWNHLLSKNLLFPKWLLGAIISIALYLCTSK